VHLCCILRQNRQCFRPFLGGKNFSNTTLTLNPRFHETNQVCLDSSSRGSLRSPFSRRDPEINLLIGALNFLYLTTDSSLKWALYWVRFPTTGFPYFKSVYIGMIFVSWYEILYTDMKFCTWLWNLVPGYDISYLVMKFHTQFIKCRYVSSAFSILGTNFHTWEWNLILWCKIS
jgi:hypothetical protein